MLRAFHIIQILFLFCCFTNCKQSNKNIGRKRTVDFFDPLALGASNKTSNLTIEARFSECGEWSGHKEKITIYADSNKNIHARYRVYPYNCDSLQFYYGNERISPIFDQTGIVGDKEKQVITDYIQVLTHSKILERSIDMASHVANVFTLTNSDSTFVIRLVTNREADKNSYKNMVSELFQKKSALK